MFAVLKTIDDRRIFKTVQLFKDVLKVYKSLKLSLMNASYEYYT